jgi:hypothetical protein
MSVAVDSVYVFWTLKKQTNKQSSRGETVKHSLKTKKTQAATLLGLPHYD